MVLSRFEMLQGAAGDVKELEYISCLHQTDLRNGIRKNASIQPVDVRLYLLSRHGISVSTTDVRKIIFSGLQADASSKIADDDEKDGDAKQKQKPGQQQQGQQDEEDEDDYDESHAQSSSCFDLMEIVAILLIPTLLKAAENGNKAGNASGLIAAPPDLLKFVLNMILHDVTGTALADSNDNEPTVGTLLTRDLVRSILVAYGEYQLALDEDLLTEMVQVVSCGGRDDRSLRSPASTGDYEVAETEMQQLDDECSCLLNVETFADALTLDVRLYDVHNETRMTTNLDDILLTQKVQGKEHQHYVPPHSNSKDAVTRSSSLRVAAAISLRRRKSKSVSHQQGQGDDGISDIMEKENDVVVVDDVDDFRERLSKSHAITRINTAPAIDVTAGTYRSKGLMVSLWCTIVLTYFCYWAGALETQDWHCEDSLYSYQGSWAENKKFLGCSTGEAVARWVLFFVSMSMYGVISVSLGSLGNSTEIKKIWWPLVGLFFVLMLTFSPTGGSPAAEDDDYDEQESGSDVQANVTDVDYENTNTTTSTESFLDMSRHESSGVMLRYITALMGTITAIFHLAHVLVLIVPHAWLERIPKAGRWITTGTVFAEMKMKRASAFKLATMTQNALNVVQAKHESRVIDTHYGQALKNYEKYGKVYVPAGGFRWAWRLILTSSSFSRTGIWLPARMVASNIAQFVMAFFILLAGLALTQHVATSYNKEVAKSTMDAYIDHFFTDAENSFVHNELVQDLMYNVTSMFSNFLSSADAATNNSLSFLLDCDNYPSVTDLDELIQSYCPPDLLDCNQTAAEAALLGSQLSNLCPLLADSNTTGMLNSSHVWALYQASGLDVNAMTDTVQSYVNAAAEQSIDSLYPAEKYMVVIPLAVGTAVAFAVAMYLALTYLPSVVMTFLQLRCGYIASLHDKDFAFYRHAQDLVSILTGSLFWGTLVSSVVVGSIIAFIIFIFLWQATIYFAQKLTVIIVGILCIAAIRMSCLCICRGSMYQAFYRTRPRAANYSMLALEWANLALSAGFVFMRMVKLLIVAGACIGKIDSEFLAEGMGKIGPIYLDAYPKIHRKDILCHEAHRHPYLEQLGVIYMMKLRYRHHFSNRAGSCWRLIFVYALMPWLHRYRVLARPAEQKKSEQQRRLSRIEAQHPEVHFVSLRNINISQEPDSDNGADESEDKNNGRIEEIGAPLARGLSSSKKAATVHFANNEDSSEMIRKLEQEVEILRSRLRAAGVMEYSLEI